MPEADRPETSTSRAGTSTEAGTSMEVIRHSDGTAVPVEVSAGATRSSSWGFVEQLRSDPSAAELFDSVPELIQARHAPNTRRSYDGWWEKFTTWLTEPGLRWRGADAGPFSVDALIPFDEGAEFLLLCWLQDSLYGPTDEGERGEWLDVRGPWSPNTLGIAISAVKARVSERQRIGWEPSTWMQNSLRGLRKKLRENYGSDHQAEPLLGAHVEAIASMLGAVDSPGAARDRLLLELHAADVDGGGISRLQLGSVLNPRPGICADSGVANAALYADTGTVGRRALVVPGQRRRGGNSDPDVVLTLDEHPYLDAALRGYLAVREGGVASGPLLVLTSTNRAAHIRSALTRLAELADVAWRPKRGVWATLSEVAAMRGVLDAGLDWSGQLRRRRDHMMVVLGFLCALRRSELCALMIRDVELRGDRALLTIRRSKTDQDMRGVRLAAHRYENPALDVPVLLGSWIAMLRDGGAGPDTVLFPSLNRHGDVLVGRDARTLRAIGGQSWADRLCELAGEAQVFGPPDASNEARYSAVSGHSLRRGFVTSALLAGHDPVTVAKQTRHRNVTMIARYAEDLKLLEGTDWSKALFGTSRSVDVDILDAA